MVYKYVLIISGPLHGQINQHGGQHPVTSFSVQDLHTGSIGYQLNPHVIADTDMCLVQVTDGYHILSFIVNFQIRQKVSRAMVQKLWMLIYLKQYYSKVKKIFSILGMIRYFANLKFIVSTVSNPSELILYVCVWK